VNSRRLALAAALLVAAAVAPAALAGDEVRIGLAAPLTGDQAYIGQCVLHGAEMAVEDANVKGPVFGSTRIRLVPLDDQHNPTQAVLAANKFVADPDVVAVVGHFNSSCTKAASTIYHESRMAQVTPGSTNPEISRQGFDTFFRVCPTDDVQAPAAADFVRSKLGIKRIAILDDQTTYGKGLADAFEKRYRSLGGEVTQRDGITQGEKDFTPLLTKIRSGKPELVYFGGIYPELALILKQAAKVGLVTRWMGGDGVAEPTLITLAGPKLAEGVYVTRLGLDPHTVPTAKDFASRYEARHGEIGPFSAYAYDAANVLIEAIRRAGSKDRQAVLAEVRKTRDLPGLLGPVNFDAQGDAIGKSIGIFQIQDGEFRFIEEARPAAGS